MILYYIILSKMKLALETEYQPKKNRVSNVTRCALKLKSV